MNSTIAVALITAASSIICQILINRNNRKKQKTEDSKKEKERAVAEALKEERLSARLNSIEKNLEENNHKLDIHNGYAEKLGSMGKDIAYIKGRMESI